jgi:hypothetical protein
MSAPKNSVRIAALCASVAMTSLLVLSQFGLADHYNTEADAILAAQRAQQLAQQASETAAKLPRS